MRYAGSGPVRISHNRAPGRRASNRSMAVWSSASTSKSSTSKATATNLPLSSGRSEGRIRRSYTLSARRCSSASTASGVADMGFIPNGAVSRTFYPHGTKPPATSLIALFLSHSTRFARKLHTVLPAGFPAMLHVRGHRRDFLRVGGFGLAGLTLADLLRAEAASPGSRPKSVIYVVLGGGPSHIDMWDLKPDAPAEFRGPFQPVATSIPGVQICEHMPR